MTLTIERLREVFDYDAYGDGNLRWKIDVCGRFPVGSIAGSLNDGGYRLVTLDQVRMRAHRMAWMIHHGQDAPPVIDHINGNRLDNRIENLRAATNQQNCCNSKARRNGLKGATFDKKAGRWLAQIMRNGKNNFLGYYDTEKDAHDAYVLGAQRFHAEFARAV